jgi:hypothetical protein
VKGLYSDRERESDRRLGDVASVDRSQEGRTRQLWRGKTRVIEAYTKRQVGLRCQSTRDSAGWKWKGCGVDCEKGARNIEVDDYWVQLGSADLRSVRYSAPATARMFYYPVITHTAGSTVRPGILNMRPFVVTDARFEVMILLHPHLYPL